MKHFRECCRLYSINEQVFCQIMLVGLVTAIVVVANGCDSETENSGLALWIILALSTGALMLCSTNRITFLDQQNKTLEVRSVAFYVVCFRRQAIDVKNVIGLKLQTITDFEGDKTHFVVLEVAKPNQGLLKPSDLHQIRIHFSRRLDPILKSGESLSNLLRVRLVRVEKESG